jgi:transcriptional regulator GlxA family with amidase domain
MKHLSIIVPTGEFILPSIIGPYMMFNTVNGYLAQQGKEPAFQIDLVGLTKEENLYGNAFAVRPTKQLSEIKKTDLIIVGTIDGDLQDSLRKNQPFVTWIKKMREENNCEVASLCMGAFLLAQTGLLDGKTCTTHWMGQDHFENMYEQIQLQPDRVITEDDGIYSSGGAFSYLNLIVYLIEKHCGKEVAIWISKIMEIDYSRESQSQFQIFQGQREHQDVSIIKAQDFIESNFHEKISVEELADLSAIGRRSFVRRFKKATANTPLEYIQRVKIEAAKKRFESSKDSINEVMYSVGYNDNKSFRKVFRKFTGITPSDYKLRYSRLMN